MRATPAGRRFQFHNGTINTYYDWKTKVDTVKFQFHNGTINTLSDNQLLMFVKSVSIPQRYN